MSQACLTGSCLASQGNRLRELLGNLLNKHAVGELLEELGCVVEYHPKVPGGSMVGKDIKRLADGLDKTCWREP